MELPVYETQRLLLREANEYDIKDLYAIYSDLDVVRYTGDFPWSKMSESEEFVEQAIVKLKEKTAYNWCVEHKEIKRVIGTCTLLDCELERKFTEMSYKILPKYWGQGIATELLPYVVTFVFETLELNRINAFVDTRNVASLKLLENIQFNREGLLRESWVDNDGNFVDEYLLGLIKRDWIPYRIRGCSR